MGGSEATWFMSSRVMSITMRILVTGSLDLWYYIDLDQVP